MPFILRKTEENPIWSAFRTRAKSEGRSMNWIIWELIRRYVKDGLDEPVRRTRPLVNLGDSQ